MAVVGPVGGDQRIGLGEFDHQEGSVDGSGWRGAFELIGCGLRGEGEGR